MQYWTLKSVVTEMVDNPDCATCACGVLHPIAWRVRCSRYGFACFYVPGQRCAGPSVRDVSAIVEQECLAECRAG